MSTTLSLSMLLLPISWAVSAERVIDVHNDAGLRRALSDAATGTTIRVAPGSYSPGIFIQDLRGTADQPIVIEGADPDRPPEFRGGGTAWQFSNCAYLTLRNLAVRGQSGNGINIAFVGVDGATVRYNTIYRPDRWVIRILQETTAPGFPPCRDGRFEHNLVVFRAADLATVVNIGPNTDPASFRFTNNLWFCEDRPQSSRPQLPVPETSSLYGIDPQLEAPDRRRFRPLNPQAQPFGAHAMPDGNP